MRTVTISTPEPATGEPLAANEQSTTAHVTDTIAAAHDPEAAKAGQKRITSTQTMEAS